MLLRGRVSTRLSVLLMAGLGLFIFTISLPGEIAFREGDAPAHDGTTPELLGMPAPEPVAGPCQPVAMERLRVKRRQKQTEEELRKQLGRVPEVGLRPDELPTLIRNYETTFRTFFDVHGEVSLQPTVLLHLRPDLARLPVRSGSA